MRITMRRIFIIILVTSLTLAFIMYTSLNFGGSETIYKSSFASSFSSSSSSRLKLMARKLINGGQVTSKFLIFKGHQEAAVKNGNQKKKDQLLTFEEGEEERSKVKVSNSNPGHRPEWFPSHDAIPDHKMNEIDSDFFFTQSIKSGLSHQSIKSGLSGNHNLSSLNLIDDQSKMNFQDAEADKEDKKQTHHQDKLKSKQDKDQVKSKQDKDQVKSKQPTYDGDKDLGMIKSPLDKKIKDEGFKKHAFNLLISDRIGPIRTLPDTRHPLCKNTSSNVQIKNKDQISVSIIICFFNEAYSTLDRTVRSILDRTPDKVLKEILLIDDFSSDNDMKYKFMRHVFEDLPEKVKYLRTPSRAGLIRARSFGANHASGSILVFLDSHVEVNSHWLPPLVNRISRNPKTVICPVIDIIDSSTFTYSASPIVKGGFNWGLHFKWDSVSSSQLRTKSDFIKPIATPTMAGGLFAMSKDFFFKLGGYDQGMDIWGGENLEMSFRIWTCGGKLEIHPCSRVGHVFRGRRPYGSPSGEDTLTKNSLRVANVWMDEYKKYYLETRPDAINVPFGDIGDRVQLRKSLKCKSFDWYLKNVYPELKPPSNQESIKRRIKMKNFKSQNSNLKNSNSNLKNSNVRKPAKVLGRYQIQAAGTDLCIESEHEVTAKGSKVILAKCQGIKRQLWSYTEKQELRLADILCLDCDSANPVLGKCHELGSTQEWKYSSLIEAPIYNPAAGMCLGVTKKQPGSTLILSICSSSDATKWNLILRVPKIP